MISCEPVEDLLLEICHDKLFDNRTGLKVRKEKYSKGEENR